MLGGFTVSAVIMGITSTRPVMMSYPEAGATQISITNITRVISLHSGDLRCLATAKEGGTLSLALKPVNELKPRLFHRYYSTKSLFDC